ncbi:hypothetical protein RRG08_045128 [Elysia crispata]|uniref:Uncharacterized protein n=1 Tax=Elysia crispata TaxID=231223 RepID=A0AAE1D422_9GAST|nr:hypothetical protein RRG08_045128 [Elysia crispata]
MSARLSVPAPPKANNSNLRPAGSDRSLELSHSRHGTKLPLTPGCQDPVHSTRVTFIASIVGNFSELLNQNVAGPL